MFCYDSPDYPTPDCGQLSLLAISTYGQMDRETVRRLNIIDSSSGVPYIACIKPIHLS